jgi:integrase
MTKVQQTPAGTETTWKWPVDPPSYDRDPLLRPAEHTELDWLVQRWEAGHPQWFQMPPHPDLHRLLRPIHDVLDLTSAPVKVRRDALRILWMEMHRRYTSFWGWTLTDWIDVVGSDGKTYRNHCHVPPDCRQQLMAIGYILYCLSDFTVFGQCNLRSLAHKVFGEERVRSTLQRVRSELLRWGYGTNRATVYIARVLYAALLMNRSPYLEDLSREVLETLQQGNLPAYLKREVVLISRVLTALGIIDKPLSPALSTGEPAANHDALSDRLSAWSEWSQRWSNTSTLAPGTRKGNYYRLLLVGRWLTKVHPDVTTPDQWTRELAAEYVAVVERMTIGQWAETSRMPAKKIGNPISARTKNAQLAALRNFFHYCQEWGWITRRFDPRRCFATPRSIPALIALDPRIIADDVWAKLLWSGLNLTQDDLPAHVYGKGSSRCESFYPLTMIRAMVLVWLFAGLRSDEFRRLRVGCVRWQREDTRVPGTDEVLPKDAICWLDVSAHKTGKAFTKAVDRLVGEAIAEWELVRPAQPVAVDGNTGEVVHYLFLHRGRQIGANYLNVSLIPLLCRKAGVPERDTRGDITSHRARSTIASQLYNAKEPLSLRTSSSTSAHTGWRVQSALFTDRRDQARHNCWKAKPTCR